jgi:hypothetical protein
LPEHQSRHAFFCINNHKFKKKPKYFDARQSFNLIKSKISLIFYIKYLLTLPLLPVLLWRGSFESTRSVAFSTFSSSCAKADAPRSSPPTRAWGRSATGRAKVRTAASTRPARSSPAWPRPDGGAVEPAWPRVTWAAGASDRSTPAWPGLETSARPRWAKRRP